MNKNAPGPADDTRFAFGENWTAYSKTSLDHSKVAQAREDFIKLLGTDDLRGKRFLDIGFGQGLSLCIASELGAETTGVDIDDNNLEALKLTVSQFNLPNPPNIVIGSILDPNLVSQLKEDGQFDIVHSWGVLHHTGDMATAIDNASSLVKNGGLFVIAIYNTHWSSSAWTVIKRIYNKSPKWIQKAMIQIMYGIIYVAKFAVTGKNPKSKKRGMNFYHDVIDWVGGYPYEHASAEELELLLNNKGFTLTNFAPCKVPTGCNEFVFKQSNPIGETNGR